MNALLNHVPIPFFDRVPPRAKAAYINVFDGIVDMAWPVESAYRHFTNSLTTNAIDGPNFKEFADWYWRVRNGLVERPHPAETLGETDERKFDCHIFNNASGQVIRPAVAAYTPTPKHAIEERMKAAIAIVKAARSLFEAQLKAGYEPPTLRGDDEIIADALREVLSAGIGTPLMDANVHMTPGNKVADLLLGEGSEEIDTKLFECLTMTMQPELCAILARQGFTASN